MSKSTQTYPWITPEIKKSTKKARQIGSFQQIRKQCKYQITNSHKAYLQTIFGDSLKENPKPFWSYIKSLRKDNQGIPTLQTPTGIPAANALVKQFTSVFTSENLETLPQIRSTHPDMPNITFGQIGIAKLVNNTNPSKAGGPDKLPARLLKETADEIAPMYTHLFTQIYKLGQLPTSWKSATICPIFKKGKRFLPENDRPVSLTAIPCKIFEHILVSQIWHHLNKYDIITSKQHGFRTGMLCETQLVEAIHDWTTILKLKFRQYTAIHTHYSWSNCTISNYKDLNRSSEFLVIN